jgi:hypothetical protein
MPKSIKVNSNPNKTPAPGKRNPTEAEWGRHDYWHNVVDPDGPPEKKKRIKINSNPTSGKTRVGNLSGIRGLGGGGMNWFTK